MPKNNVKKDAKKLQKAVNKEKKTKLYEPGPLRIVELLKEKYQFRTIPEIGSDHESIYYFNGQIYERAEELIKKEAHNEYIRQYTKVLKLAEREENAIYIIQMRKHLNEGPSVKDINEAMAMIRRTTFTYDEMNPPSHIPFKNGLLNLKTRKLEPFTPDLFYTYQVNANLLSKHITLRDIPQFAYLLDTAFYECDVPTVLSYFAYSFYPDLTVHKILLVLGRERIGKGTTVRVLQGLIEKGSGSISLARLLTSDRFQFTGIDGKNLLVDSETRRKFRRGTVLEWSAFCNLFGKDVLSIEPKGHEAHDYISRAKGIFLGNLPFIPVDSPPAISRILLVVTKDDRPKKIIPDLDRKILDSERDEIATLLMQILFKLIDRNFLFPGQLTDDSTAQLIEQLADPVENFIEEETEYDKDCSVQVDDAYSRFLEWCKNKGIPRISRQTFVKKFGRTYPKKRIGAHGKGGYVFMGCLLYESEVKVTEGDKKQVGTQLKLAETQKISLSRDHYRRFQHEYYYLRVKREEKDHDHNIKDSALKLEPDGSFSKNLENKAPVENELGSNLYRESDTVQDENRNNEKGSASNNGTLIARDAQENDAKNSISENVRISADSQSVKTSDNEKTDTHFQNNSPHSPYSPRINGNSGNSDAQSENSKTYRYIVMKDFPLYGHVYQPGIEFEHTIYFDNELRSGILKLVEDRKERFRDTLDRSKSEWIKNPRKALFDFVEKEAPETKFHSLTPKGIRDMLPVPNVDLSTIYELCEELTKEGAFLKNKAGAYSVNAEFVNGGVRDFFKEGD